VNRIVFEIGYFLGLAKISWHTDTPSTLLPRAREAGWLPDGARVLEVGCGLGTNTRWLAEHGFDVTGVDLSSVAVGRVRRDLARHGLKALVYQADFLAGIDEAPFDVIFDRATLHSFPAGSAERAVFTKRLSDLVRPGGSLLLAEVQRIPRLEARKVPPFPVELDDLRGLFGPSFDVTFVGLEHQRHRVLGELPFGQWRVQRLDAAAA